MMVAERIEITFDLGNAAFHDENGDLILENVADQIEKIADRIREGQTTGTIRDVNNEQIGSYKVTAPQGSEHQ